LPLCPHWPKRKSPTVIFILVDNVGWGNFGVYGGTVSTPRNGSARTCVGAKGKVGESNSRAVDAQGNKYRERLIKARVAADEKVRHQLTPEERATLLRLLKLITELEF
jgi:hypothetical protein